MAKQKKRKSGKKSHWLSFRDDLIPWANRHMFGPAGRPIDYEGTRKYFASGCTGFGDFLLTDIGRFIYSGHVRNYAPMANEIYSVILWDACGRIILRPSEGLLRLLMETDASVPIQDVKPPFPSVYIELPKNFLYIPDVNEKETMVSASGMYVAWGETGARGEHSANVMLAGGTSFNDCSHQARLLMVGPGTTGYPIHEWTLRYQSLCWGDNCHEGVDDIVSRHLDLIEEKKKTTTPGQRDFSGTVWSRIPVDEFMMRITANLFLYMSCPDADILTNPDELHERLDDLKKRGVSSKRKKRVRRQIHDGMIPSMTVDVGSSIVIRPGMYVESPDAPSEGGRKSPRPHWRRGHFRNVRYGAERKKKKIKWIMPVLVRKNSGGGTTEIKPYEVK